KSLVDILRHRAQIQANERAYVFLADRGGEEAAMSFAELDHRARALAAHLRVAAGVGERALLLFPPGLDFLVGFFGCLYAGIIAVPMMLPRRYRPQESNRSIVEDCAPRFALTCSSFMASARPSLADLPRARAIDWIAVDEAPSGSPSGLGVSNAITFEPTRDTLAFLQYTSGSTSAPKGVMVSHGNLLDNLEMIRVAYDNGRASTHVSWVPLYHDMGLILNALQALYVGAACVLMAPVAFMQRPLSWLRAIDHYRAEVAGGPNFAFDLCVERFRPDQVVGLDLSHWKLAINGAEPVRADTLERFAQTFAPYGFRREALFPCYGMAEATLLISGGQRGAGYRVRPVGQEALQQNRLSPAYRDEAARLLIGCGKKLVGEEIAIVHPHTRRRVMDGSVGEIWVHGPNVASGYWRQPMATRETFQARIAGEGAPRWLRTGDLGCLDGEGELYITGRLKDVIIVRGANHYPQDIERTVERSHPALRPHCSAAFTVSRQDQEVLIVVQEVERTFRHRLDIAEVTGAVRMAVVREHELTVHDVVLIRTGTIPKTTSGKIRRRLTRQLYLDGALDVWSEARARPHDQGMIPSDHDHSPRAAI
ncbi:MAG TPA: fatty acyl-AMP ligase, partial [Stellaceae bacterium]|nr:fatty acyl-AMP ligase [Stellaceae bacterium]